MSHNLIQIGNSKALIIPARIIKKRNYDNKTEFDIIETYDGFRIVQKKSGIESLKFPKVAKPAISDSLKKLKNVAKLTEDEIEKDERLKYILSR